MRCAYVQLSRWDLGLFRLLGPGLGNLLFPWARAAVASKLHDLTPIWPTWQQFKIGPMLRSETDLRIYSGLFKNPGNYIDGAKKYKLIATAKRLTENDLSNSRNSWNVNCNYLICFQGLGSFFKPILNSREYIRNELLRITRSEHLEGISHDFKHSITVHVRLGDYKPFDDKRLRVGDFNTRLPITWISETIHFLRLNLGEEWPVWVFSDGNDAELKDLLNLPNVERLHFGSALADMHAMSRSNVLIVSSSFSMWSAYLGAVPSVYYPGQLRQRLIPGQRDYEVEREHGKRLEEGFINVINHKGNTL